MNPQIVRLQKNVHILFYIGLAGQLAFALYISLSLWVSALQANWEAWNGHMANGIIEGDKLGNAGLILHVFLAFTITVGGPLQFIPSIRSKFAKFHKWNGRIYIFSVILTSLVATGLIWSRPLLIGGISGLVGNSINAFLIVVFGILTGWTALKGDFEAHRKWAIRTYIVVSGVWFFRIMFGTWLLITGFKAPGVTEDLTGWFSNILYFGSYLIPLAISEVYIRLKNSDNRALVKFYSWFIIFLCPLLIGGTIVTTMVFWLK